MLAIIYTILSSGFVSYSTAVEFEFISPIDTHDKLIIKTPHTVLKQLRVVQTILSQDGY